MKVIVVGGGLAGMSAASALADLGASVELLERSPRLGGRASSIFNKALGVPIDTGQHALLGCCTNLLHLYQELNLLEFIRFRNCYPFIEHGEQSILSAYPAPEPLHLVPSLISLGALSAIDKAHAGKLLWSALDFKAYGKTASEWLADCGQSETAIRSFWEPILVGALNESLSIASAEYAALVIRKGMLQNRTGLELGVAQVPLGDLHDVSGRRSLEEKGIRIRTGVDVTEVCVENGRMLGVRSASGEIHPGDYAIIAVTPATSLRLVEPYLDEKTRCNPVQVPIITLYLWFEESLGMPDVACIPGGYFHWCFERSRIEPIRDGMGSSLSMVASSAKDFYRRSDEEIMEIGVSELRESFGFSLPAPDGFSVVRYRNATFSPTVGCDDRRPAQKTSIPNLLLAGEWTQTGWPGTMEGAVRSGYKCAGIIAQNEGLSYSLPLPDLGWGWARTPRIVKSI